MEADNGACGSKGPTSAKSQLCPARRSFLRGLVYCLPAKRSIQYFGILLVCATLCENAFCFAETGANPRFSPGTGTYTSVQSVTICDATSGATIYCTIIGTTPTASSIQCNSMITDNSTDTSGAITTKRHFQSLIATPAYPITSRAATPTLSLAAWTYPNSQLATISDLVSGDGLYMANETTASSNHVGVHPRRVAGSHAL